MLKLKKILFSILAFLPLVGFGQINDSVLWYVDFDNHSTGLYNVSEAEDDFTFGGTTDLRPAWGLIDDGLGGYDSTKIVDVGTPYDNVLRGEFPFSTYGIQGGFDLRPTFPNTFNELYFSYDIYFKPGFEFADGGKLFGIFEGGNEGLITLPVESYDPDAGWLVMFMWNEYADVFFYIYYPDMDPGWGEGYSLPGFKIQTGKWYNFAFRLVINTGVGSYDAVVSFFANGQLVGRKTGFRLKQNSDDDINSVRLNTFFGGGDECTHQTWRREYIDFDNLCLWMPDTVGSVPQGNSQYWGAEDIIPVPYTNVALNGWEEYTGPATDCPVSDTWTDSTDYIIYWDSIVPYPNDCNCDFNIEVPGADSIQLYFTSFYTEGECGKYDYLDIKQTNSGGDLVESMYGVSYSFPYIVNVTGNDVYMNFISGGSGPTRVGSGIRMYYWAYDNGAMMDSTLYKEYMGLSEPEEPEEPETHDTTDYEHHVFSGATYGSNGISLSQSFTVGTVGLNQAHNIDSIAVKLYTEDVTDSITFDLYAELNDTMTGSSLSYGVLKDFPTTATIKYIDMTEYILQPNTSYVLVMESHGTGFIFWSQDESNGYAGGMSAYIPNPLMELGNSWWTESTYDFWFEIFGTSIGVCTTYEYYLATDDIDSPVYTDKYEGQSFTIGTVGSNTNFVIDSLRIKGYRIGSPGDITIKISSTKSDMPIGSVLSTGTFNANSLTMSEAGEWFSVSMTNALLYADSSYVWWVESTGSPSNEFRLRGDFYGTYSGGKEIYYQLPQGWLAYNNIDNLFEICGHIPYPTSVGITRRKLLIVF